MLQIGFLAKLGNLTTKSIVKRMTVRQKRLFLSCFDEKLVFLAQVWKWGICNVLHEIDSFSHAALITSNRLRLKSFQTTQKAIFEAFCSLKPCFSTKSPMLQFTTYMCQLTIIDFLKTLRIWRLCGFLNYLHLSNRLTHFNGLRPCMETDVKETNYKILKKNIANNFVQLCNGLEFDDIKCRTLHSG